MSDREIVVVRAPDQEMMLVFESGECVRCTSPSAAQYEGKSRDDALFAAISVLRWPNPEIDDNDYPEVIDLGPFDRSRSKGDRAMPAIGIGSRVYSIPEGAVELEPGRSQDDVMIWMSLPGDPLGQPD